MDRLEFEADLDKTTKNTQRYAEITEDHPPYVNTIYVQKWAIAQLGHPRRIKVTVEGVA